ncbi:MAG: hypothetical protein ACLPTZ_23075 [Beijerinckiaceae bacterium]|jgi:hypothetical protein
MPNKSINPAHIEKALLKLEEVQTALKAALAEVKTPPPNPPPGSTKVFKGRKMRRV